MTTKRSGKSKKPAAYGRRGRFCGAKRAQKCILVEEGARRAQSAPIFGPFAGGGGYLRSLRTHWPVSASWNIIQSPRPSGSNTERGINEQNPRSASGGAVRAAAGTP